MVSNTRSAMAAPKRSPAARRVVEHRPGLTKAQSVSADKFRATAATSLMRMLPPTISAAALTTYPPVTMLTKPIAAVYPPNWARALAETSWVTDQNERLRRIDKITRQLVNIGLARDPHDTSRHESGGYGRGGGA